MISQTKVSASCRHCLSENLNEFPKVLNNVSLELGKQRDQFRISIESKVDNPLATIERFKKQFQVGEKEAVEWRGNREAGNTMLPIVKAYNRASSLMDYWRKQDTGFRRSRRAILEMVK